MRYKQIKDTSKYAGGTVFNVFSEVSIPFAIV